MKLVLGLGFLMALSTCVHATVTNVVWYRLGEDDPGAVPGLAATNTTDLIGLRDLKAFGSPLYSSAVSTDASNSIGSMLAVQFNGSSQYFSNTTVSMATNNFGIEAWVKPTTLSSSLRLIAYNGDTTTDGWGIYQIRTNYFGVFGGVVSQIGGTAATAMAGAWTHVALVRDNGVAALYINGVANHQVTNAAPQQVVKGDGFAIGVIPQSPPAGAFNGVIDEVRVFTFGARQFRTSDLLINLQRVATLPASGLTWSNATLNGVANPCGLSATAWFEWGITTNYGSLTAAHPVGNGTSSTNFSEILTGLVSGATYQFRAVVSNSLGVAYGVNMSVAIPLPPQVLNTDDSGPGSLRQLISDAAPGDTITFAPGLTGMITLTTGPLVIDKSLNIIGPGPKTMFLSGSSATTVLQLSGGDVVLSGVSVTAGGDYLGNPAINNGADLIVSNCELIANAGPALEHNSNNLVVLNCSFVTDFAGGLVIASNATASVTNCTFTSDYGTLGSAIYNQGMLTLISCTVAWNITTSDSGGGGIYSTGTVHIGNTVVADNFGYPGGVYTRQDAAGNFTSLGYNFIAASDGSIGFTNGVNGDHAGTSAAPLDPYFSFSVISAYNGGQTLNVTPLLGSPLIDQGNSFGVTTDQRGFARTVDFPQIANASGGDGSDIGAVELGSSFPCSACATQVTVDVSQTLRPVDGRWFGANVASFVSGFDMPDNLSLLTEMGCRSLRFPGGGMSDAYHWSSNYWTGHGTQPTTFGNFMHIATNLGANVFITVNYGTGTTNEAADWVRSANITNHCGFKYWEVGNENYWSGEVDSNTAPPYQPHDPSTYAKRFRDYYTAMKAVDPTIKVGAVVTPGEDTDNTAHSVLNPRTGLFHNGWDPVMFATMKTNGGTPDFVIHHFYPENGVESDPELLQAPPNWGYDAVELRQEITDYFGSDGTNIELLCTENNSDASYSQGRQSTSLVNGLYLADSLGQLMKTEFSSYLWWLFESGADTKGSFSPSLYGWRTYGDFGLVLNANTKYPTYYAMKLIHDFVQPGDVILDTGNGSPFLDVFAAISTNGALSVLVINKDRTNTFTRQVTLAGFSPNAAATVRFYGIAQDEATRTNGPAAMQDIATNHMAVAGGGFLYAFPPYSLTLFTFVPIGPTLTVSRPASDTLVVSWPWPSVGWNLQQNTDLNTSNWIAPSETIQNDGTNNFISITLPTGNLFFRLTQP